MSELTTVIDPVLLVANLWPHITLYDKQREILYSLIDNDETVVPAGNQLGKDFIAGLAVLYFFLSRHPCRVVTTSVDETQLKGVLWGEIKRFIQTSVVGLSTVDGGPLLVNDLFIRKIVNGKLCELSYILGRVASQGGEGLLGHHCFPDKPDGIPHSLFVGDECSGIPRQYYVTADTWAKRKLYIGNPFQCNNYFKDSVKKGIVYSDDGNRCYTNVIKIKAEHSPNVRFALAQIANGEEPTDEVLVSGLKTWSDYVKHRKVWDPIKQCICLDAEFYEGAEVLMFPTEWLNHSEQLAKKLRVFRRVGKTMGVDTAEGGDSSVWTIADEKGILKQISYKTPNTSVITTQTIMLMREFSIDPEDVLFDIGGGGKEHADRLRDQGYHVRTIAFGGAPTSPDEFSRVRSYRPLAAKVDEKETRQRFKNRRAEMYWAMRQLIDPENGGWGIPEEYTELRRQLAPMPIKLGPEGEIMMLPKSKKSPDSKEETLVEILGCSPDEADSAALAAFGLIHKPVQIVAGGVGRYD